MTRILLFLATNAAVLVLISIVFRLLGIEGILAQNGVDLNLQALLVLSALALGDNLLTLQVTDLAGNSASFSDTLTRVVQTRADAVLDWNSRALQVIQLDVTDPPLATRTLAMMSLAVYDSLAAIQGTPAYMVQRSVVGAASADAAVAVASHRILSLTYPGQRSALDNGLAASLAAIADGTAKDTGIALGLSVADAVWAARQDDGSKAFTDYAGGTALGQWRPTGPTYELADDPQWKTVTPFAISAPSAFRAPPPPALDTAAYAAAIEEVKRLGSATSAERTTDQTEQALFWADGAGSYTPPGHWNQIAAQVALAEGNSLSTNARLFAQLNVALADAAIACWDTKYTFGFWRPETAIQNAALDGNSATSVDATWRPLLISPPHPDYVSGHPTFSAAAATILWLFLARRIHGTARQFALALVMGGALGNLVDRVMTGEVVDFVLLSWRHWQFPVFNVADPAVVGGAILLVVLSLFG